MNADPPVIVIESDNEDGSTCINSSFSSDEFSLKCFLIILLEIGFQKGIEVT